METNALLVLDTWANATEFKTDLINTMKSNGLNIITDLEATDIVLAVNYMTSLIYSYYKNYYLSNASKERTLELMSITASGKLNFYASELKAYKDAYAHDFKSLGGNENSSSHDTTLNRSGKSKQATTPETIAKGSDYIDDYSSSEHKYENSNKETGTRSYNSTIKGSEQDYWKNIISIPKRLFEDIIGSFSKFFFSSSMELTPCAVLTIEQAIQKLKDEIKALDTTTKAELSSLSSLITATQKEVSITQERVDNLQTSVVTLASGTEKLDTRVVTLEGKTAQLEKKTTKTDTNLENLTKVTPTDIGVKDNKLGLKHDTTWLTNQDAITLGDNLTYDDTTKTLNAKGSGGGIVPVEVAITEEQLNTYNRYSYIDFTEEQYNVLKNNCIISIIITIAGTKYIIVNAFRTVNIDLEVEFNALGFMWCYSDYVYYFRQKYDKEHPRRLIYTNVEINQIPYYNNLDIGKFLTINEHQSLAWGSLKKYFSHDIKIMFNYSPLMLNITNTSNTPIDSITDIKTACGSRKQVMMTGVFQDDDLMRVVTMYNPQTNKIITSSTTGAVGEGNEILLATHSVYSNDYTLGAITDDITPL